MGARSHGRPWARASRSPTVTRSSWSIPTAATGDVLVEADHPGRQSWAVACRPGHPTGRSGAVVGRIGQGKGIGAIPSTGTGPIQPPSSARFRESDVRPCLVARRIDDRVLRVDRYPGLQRRIHTTTTTCDDQWQLHVMSLALDGSEPRELHKAGTCYCIGGAPSLTWSPDGTSLAFVGFGRDSFPGGLTVMNANGTGLRQVTEDGGRSGLAAGSVS